MQRIVVNKIKISAVTESMTMSYRAIAEPKSQRKVSHTEYAFGYIIS